MWQKATSHCKAINLQLKVKAKKPKNSRKRETAAYLSFWGMGGRGGLRNEDVSMETENLHRVMEISESEGTCHE